MLPTTTSTSSDNTWTSTYKHCFKNGPDRPVRPVQPGTGSQSGPVNTPKTGQQPVKNRAKTGVEPEIKKKNGLMSGSVFKTMPISLWITMENLIPSIVFVEFLAKIAVTESDSNEHVVDY